MIFETYKVDIIYIDKFNKEDFGILWELLIGVALIQLLISILRSTYKTKKSA